jgi:hypothetical protein
MPVSLHAIKASALSKVLRDEDALADVLDDESDDVILEEDLDEAWHAVHFALTGSETAGEGVLDFLIAGGAEATLELDEGPARGFDAAATAEIAAALARVDFESIASGFSVERLAAAKVHPDQWGEPRPDGDTHIDWVLDHLQAVRSFMAAAASAKAAVIVAKS